MKSNQNQIFFVVIVSEDHLKFILFKTAHNWSAWAGTSQPRATPQQK